MSTVGRQYEKVEHGCATTSLPLSNGIKKRFCTPTPSWRNRAHKPWLLQAWRTDKQTKNSTFFVLRRRVKSEPHQTRCGDRGPRARARSCTYETFGVWHV